MVMVSMCLAGKFCRYNGKTQTSPLIAELEEKGIEYILFCPECMGGLQTPREPAEIAGGTGEDVLDGKTRILNRVGEDVTEFFIKGAQAALALAESCKPEKIYMKTRSPSCGNETIYDGTFSGKLIHGSGVTAALLKKHGYEIEAIDE